MSGRAGRWIFGRHVVEEAFSSGALRLIEVWLDIGAKRELGRAAKAAQRAGAKLRWVPRRELDRIAGGARHQGMAARVDEGEARGLEGLLRGLSKRERSRTVLVALDRIQDPQNLGAIARSAVCLGARALISPERHSVPLTQAVLRSSAGAAQKIPFFRVGNLAQTLLRLKEEGFWVYGGDRSGQPVWKVRLNPPMVLVIGSEGKGIRPLVRSCCDELVAVPQARGGVASLNASCAASVLLYEAARQGERK